MLQQYQECELLLFQSDSRASNVSLSIQPKTVVICRYQALTTNHLTSHEKQKLENKCMTEKSDDPLIVSLVTNLCIVLLRKQNIGLYELRQPTQNLISPPIQSDNLA
jgi:hypothetical protein